MGDYYKYKKILVILMIVSCGFSIIRNIFKSNVQATEFTPVTPVSNDGTYSVQTDNQFMTLQENQKTIQGQIISQLWWLYDNGYADNVRYTVNDIRQYMCNKKLTGYTSYLYFGINASGEYFYEYTHSGYLNDNNIQVLDAQVNTGYKMFSVPFYVYTRYGNSGIKTINKANGTISNYEGQGQASIPCAELGAYSERWIDLFLHCGLLTSDNDYNSVLSSIQETNELNYTQNYYTKQAVQNTYSYITNDNVNNITSTGISQPQVNEPDISDAFDSLSDLLTNDNAATKFFTFTLPNGSSHVFALSPDFLRTSLTRVGGGELVTIIETLWYIGLYGLMIFTGLKIIGALLSGDLDAVTGVLSPVNSVVNSSLEVTGAFRTAGGDESAFRIRKG